MRNVIVVVGSVTSEQYTPIRLLFVREGVKVEIIRIADVWCETFLITPGSGSDGDLNIVEYTRHFERRTGVRPEEVVTVVALPKDWPTDYPYEPDDNPFNSMYADAWPRMRSVLLVQDGWLEEV